MDGPCRLRWDRCRYRAHLLGRAGARRKGVDARVQGRVAGDADPACRGLWPDRRVSRRAGLE